MHDSNVVLVDLRPEYLYSKAHIPGAINIPWTETLNGESTWWKSPEKLEEIFNANGVTKEKEVVVYVNSPIDPPPPVSKGSLRNLVRDTYRANLE